MTELSIAKLATMNEAQIVALATQHGYTVRDAPGHYASAGKRIGGSKVKEGNDMLFEKNDNTIEETEATIEQGEDIIEWMDSEAYEAESNPIRALADDYAYFVKQLIDAGLRDSYAYEILKLVIAP